MNESQAIRSEDIEDQLTELFAEAEGYGQRAEQAALRGGEEVRHLPTKPDPSGAALAELRELLEAELVVAKPAAGEAVIARDEEEREIAKRALAHVRSPQLREIAARLGVRRSGKVEDLLDRIVRSLEADQEEIAKLVIEYETEPPPERRFTTRVFHLWDSVDDLTPVAERTALFSRRYLRTGIARWFIIEAVDSSARQLAMTGVFRYISADATHDDDAYRLVSRSADAAARLTLSVGQPVLAVEARGATESRASIVAFQHASGLRWRADPPLPTTPGDDELIGWDPRSVFLVDLLHARFRSDAIEILNLSTAGFQTSESVRQQEEDEASRPAVRAVKLDGRHLLDSRAACELLVAGQGLVELGMLVRFRTSASEDFLLPVTIRQERDHTAVMTGYGMSPPAVAQELQQALIRGVSQGFRKGLSDPVALRGVARQIRERAEQDTPIRRATIFPPAPEATGAAEPLEDDEATEGDDVVA